MWNRRREVLARGRRGRVRRRDAPAASFGRPAPGWVPRPGNRRRAGDRGPTRSTAGRGSTTLPTLGRRPGGRRRPSRSTSEVVFWLRVQRSAPGSPFRPDTAGACGVRFPAHHARGRAIPLAWTVSPTSRSPGAVSVAGLCGAGIMVGRSCTGPAARSTPPPSGPRPPAARRRRPRPASLPVDRYPARHPLVKPRPVRRSVPCLVALSPSVDHRPAAARLVELGLVELL